MLFYKDTEIILQVEYYKANSILEELLSINLDKKGTHSTDFGSLSIKLPNPTLCSLLSKLGLGDAEYTTLLCDVI